MLSHQGDNGLQGAGGQANNAVISRSTHAIFSIGRMRLQIQVTEAHITLVPQLPITLFLVHCDDDA
jgi:hypothetical protein